MIHNPHSLQAQDVELHTLISPPPQKKINTAQGKTSGLPIQANTNFSPSSATYQSCDGVGITTYFRSRYHICNLLPIPQNCVRIQGVVWVFE